MTTVSTALPDRPSHWAALKADAERYRQEGFSTWDNLGFWGVTAYRLQSMSRDMGTGLLTLPFRIASALIWRLVSLVTGINIGKGAEIGPGLVLPHAGPIWVADATKIGSNCTVLHGVTIGEGTNGAAAVIGNRVWLSPHASIIGRLSIGDGASVAANTLVITDVPAGATAIGVPAKIIPGRAAGAKPAA